MSSEAPLFIIRETSGPRRTVILKGRGLPFRPITIEGEQRVKITNPSGNPVGFGSPMGPTHGETSINGFWKDRHVGDSTDGPCIELVAPSRTGNPNPITTQVSAVQDAVLLFESIRDSGQLLEVTWGWVIRRGFMKKFSAKIHNVHDVEWDASFAWTSASRPTTSPLFGPPAGAIENPIGLNSALRAFRNILDAPTAIINEHMETFRNEVARVTENLQQLEASFSGIAETSGSVLEGRRLESMLGGCVQSATNVYETFLDAGWAGILQEPQSVLPFSDYLFPSLSDTRRWRTYEERLIEAIDPDEIFKAQLYERESLSDARRLRDEAETRRRLLVAPAGAIMATYVASEGDDLMEVARRYYGDRSKWRSIYIYNSLNTIELYAGQTVIIPRLEANPDLQT